MKTSVLKFGLVSSLLLLNYSAQASQTCAQIAAEMGKIVAKCTVPDTYYATTDQLYLSRDRDGMHSLTYCDPMFKSAVSLVVSESPPPSRDDWEDTNTGYVTYRGKRNGNQWELFISSGSSYGGKYNGGDFTIRRGVRLLKHVRFICR